MATKNRMFLSPENSRRTCGCDRTNEWLRKQPVKPRYLREAQLQMNRNNKNGDRIKQQERLLNNMPNIQMNRAVIVNVYYRTRGLGNSNYSRELVKLRRLWAISTLTRPSNHSLSAIKSIQSQPTLRQQLFRQEPTTQIQKSRRSVDTELQGTEPKRANNACETR
ncbi:hypothetical protein NPIL_347431 [Nephila pilipes]|uniref:Uncharacterized protein n=1 Tax=Nephila pilipes TaxID=299642 RepID=A0A8X6TVU2_NEPPI|nr:hypothetical protein NPIL_347431 [Nephila pilipes]